MTRLPALLLAAAVLAQPLAAESVVALRTIRAGEVIGAAHVALDRTAVPGAAERPEDVVGLEARRMIYTGRPVLNADVGPPAIFERNAIVPLLFRHGALTITAEGRTLSRAGIGDRVRVMNLNSRKTVHGVVSADGAVVVDGSD